jgi:hypothetical protein
MKMNSEMRIAKSGQIVHSQFSKQRNLLSLTFLLLTTSVQQCYFSKPGCTMAKKSLLSSDRSDPKANKSLAIRSILKKLPNAKGSEVVAAVKKEYGHDVKINMVYMVKTKQNMASDGRAKSSSRSASDRTLGSAAQWVEAIKAGRELLRATGSMANATALLKALDR